MKILVTVPNEHWIHQHVTMALLRLRSDQRYQLLFDLPAQRPYENNLHHIVRDFVQGDCDFWLSLDSDNPPICNPLDLVELDKDIIGLPTPIWHWSGKIGERPIYWNGYDYDPRVDAYHEHITREGLQHVDAIGSGCMLIAKRVFLHPKMQTGVFRRKLYKNGTVDKGTDIAFCERARKCGFTIWCHYDYPCRHFCEIDLHEVSLAIKGLMEREVLQQKAS